MSANDTYLAVFTSNKASPRWQAWYEMSDEERRAKDEEGSPPWPRTRKGSPP